MHMDQSKTKKGTWSSSIGCQQHLPKQESRKCPIENLIFNTAFYFRIIYSIQVDQEIDIQYSLTRFPIFIR